MPKVEIAPLEPFAVDVPTAAKLLRVSERSVWTLLKENLLPSVSIGGSRRIPIDALRLLAKVGTAAKP